MSEPWKKRFSMESVTSPEAIAAEQAVTARVEQPWTKRFSAPWGEVPKPIQTSPGASYGGSGPMFEKVFANLIQAESRGKHRAEDGGLLTSPAGAQGITQVMPQTGSSPGYNITPLRDDSEDEYKRFGRDYLGAMLTQFGGDYPKALAAYNAGAGNVQKAITRAAKAGKDNDWMDFLPKKEETIPYVNKIMKGLQ